MKTTKKILAMFFVAATMTLMSCEKDETTPEPAIQLAGTSWECEMNNVIYESGIQMNISLLSMIDFTDGPARRRE